MKSKCMALTNAQLKQMCKDNKVKGYSKLKHDELVVQCCEAFSSELGASPVELQSGKKREIEEKISSVNVLKDVLKKKMLIASEWLDNFKKTTGTNFAFGSLDDRRIGFDHDPVTEEVSDRYGYGRRTRTDYYKSSVRTNPLSVEARGKRDYSKFGYVFYLAGDSLVACDSRYDPLPCISDTGRKHRIRKPKGDEEDKIPYSKLIAREYLKDKTPFGDLSDYQKDRLKEDSLICFHDPEKCASGKKEEIVALDRAVTSLERANDGMDKLKIIIKEEKERIRLSEKDAREKQQRARASLEEWKGL